MNRKINVALVVMAIGIAVAATHPSAHLSPLTVKAACDNRPNVTGPSKGQCAPGFTLPDIAGKPVTLASFRGRPILLHFWAVACPTCAAEYPDFSRVVARYASRGVHVIGVDAWGESSGLVRAWQLKHHLQATLLIDEAAGVVNEYRVQGTPTTLFIDRSGRVVQRNLGPLTYSDYSRTLDTMLS